MLEGQFNNPDPGDGANTAIPHADAGLLDNGGQSLETTQVNGRFSVIFAEPLDEFTRPHGKAFVARDLLNASRPLYAMVVNPGIPIRGNVIAQLIEKPIKGILNPISVGVIDHPAGGSRQAIIFERPLGGCVLSAPPAGFAETSDATVRGFFLERLVVPLNQMARDTVAHRSVNPQNIFYWDVDRLDIVIGDCVSAPPGYSQPSLYEPIESIAALPEGRGEGRAAHDCYAVGMTMAAIVARKFIWTSMSDADVIAARFAKTSSALLDGSGISIKITHMLRGLLRDDPGSRWGWDEVIGWIQGVEQTSRGEAKVKAADWPIKFGEHEYINRRYLAMDFAAHPEKAAVLVASGMLKNWVESAASDPDAGLALAELSLQYSKDNKIARVDDKALVASKACGILDPVSPIRYKSLSLMPSALGFVLARAAYTGNEQRLVDAETLINSRLLDEGHTGTEGFDRYGPGWTARLKKLRSFLGHNTTGKGIFRVLYTLCPMAPCYSPLVVGRCPDSIHRLLLALDAKFAENPDPDIKLDQHISAFIGAHYFQAEPYFAILGKSSNDARTRDIIWLDLLAELQLQHCKQPLPGIVSWLSARLAESTKAIRNKNRREYVTAQLKELSGHGDIGLLRNSLNLSAVFYADRNGFENARRRCMVMDREIARLEQPIKADDPQTVHLAGKIAVRIGVAALICSTVITLFVQYFG